MARGGASNCQQREDDDPSASHQALRIQFFGGATYAFPGLERLSTSRAGNSSNWLQLLARTGTCAAGEQAGGLDFSGEGDKSSWL